MTKRSKYNKKAGHGGKNGKRYQRENLSAIEKIETIVEILDAELIEDKEYLSMGDKPADRVKKLLGKI